MNSFDLIKKMAEELNIGMHDRIVSSRYKHDGNEFVRISDHKPRLSNLDDSIKFISPIDGVLKFVFICTDVDIEEDEDFQEQTAEYLEDVIGDNGIDASIEVKFYNLDCVEAIDFIKTHIKL